MKAIFAAALALFWSASATPCAIAYPMDQYGAIALGGDGFGAAQSREDEASAAASAIAQCEESGGAGECKVRLAYRNQCAALAVGDNRFVGVAYAKNIAEAQKLAQRSCKKSTKGCGIVYAACSPSIP